MFLAQSEIKKRIRVPLKIKKNAASFDFIFLKYNCTWRALSNKSLNQILTFFRRKHALLSIVDSLWEKTRFLSGNDASTLHWNRFLRQILSRFARGHRGTSGRQQAAEKGEIIYTP